MLRRLKRSTTVAVLLLLTAACNSGHSTPTYAIAPSDREGSAFTHDLAALGVRNGLSPRLGRSTDSDPSRTLYVLEAHGHWMRIWSQNVEVCDFNGSPRPDPRQYVIFVEPILPILPNGDADALAVKLKSELAAMGYELRDQESPCIGRQGR